MDKKEKASKKGKWCGFIRGATCNEDCGLFCQGLQMCVMHGINAQLRDLVEAIKNLKKKK